MKKIDVNIFTDVRCCRAEAAWFKQLDRMLSAKLRSATEIRGVPCPGGSCPLACRPTTTPHVTINGRLLPHATPGEVVETVRRILRKADNKSLEYA